MTLRLRFVIFFVSGVAVMLATVLVFYLSGIFQIQAPPETIAIAGVVSALIAVMAVFFILIFLRKYDKPVVKLIHGIEEISRGNLSPDLPDDAPAEFGLIRNALLTMCGQMRMIISQLESLSSHVVDTTDGAGGSFKEVERGASTQAEFATRAFEDLGKLSRDLSAMSRNASDFGSRMEKSAGKVAKMEVAVGHVSEIIGSLSTTIDNASQGTMSADSSSRVLAKDVSTLLMGVDGAGAALRDMVAGAKRAQTDAQEAAVILGNLESETGRISEAIEDIIKGSDAAYASNDRILQVTAMLQSRVDKVDDVIEVIGSLAERTKLLSINASIIASEAGEHGRAFAVVANEVKELAGSTARAISEISKVVVGLKEGFSDTVESIQKGQEDVEEGVRLARNAVGLLGSVPDQVHQAAACNAEIVERTEKQVEKGSEVEEVMVKLGSTLAQVDQLLAEQVTRTDRSMALFGNISTTADQVMSVIKSQKKITKGANVDLVATSDNFREIDVKLRESVRNLENVVELSRDVLGITTANRERTESLSRLISDLNRYALFLGDDFRKVEPSEAN